MMAISQWMAIFSCTVTHNMFSVLQLGGWNNGSEVSCSKKQQYSSESHFGPQTFDKFQVAESGQAKTVLARPLAIALTLTLVPSSLVKFIGRVLGILVLDYTYEPFHMNSHNS